MLADILLCNITIRLLLKPTYFFAFRGFSEELLIGGLRPCNGSIRGHEADNGGRILYTPFPPKQTHRMQFCQIHS